MFLFLEEANFDWPTYLLGEDYDQPISSHDESLNNEDHVDATFVEDETNGEIEIESKPIDLIEQQN